MRVDGVHVTWGLPPSFNVVAVSDVGFNGVGARTVTSHQFLVTII